MANTKEKVEAGEEHTAAPAVEPVTAIPVGVGTSGANVGGTSAVVEEVTPASNVAMCPRCHVAWNATNRSGKTIPCTCGFLVRVA